MYGASMALTALADPAPAPAAQQDPAPKDIHVTAEQSFEYYEDKKLYVARGKAKAIRGTMTVTADILTAHERDKAPNAPKSAKTSGNSKSEDTSDIDWMTAEGHVDIVDPKQHIIGEHAVYDLVKHKMIVTGNNLRYETAREVVTATDSLEYYEDTKLAVARGHAIADQPTRHIEGDTLTAEFRDAPNGQSQLTKMTAQGHVTVITKSTDSDKSGAASEDKKTQPPQNPPAKKKGGDVSRGNRAVYDAGSNVAILTGDVHMTRPDGTQLSGEVGEVDFNNNQNRLMDNGHSRVKALLPSKTTDKATNTPSVPESSPNPAPEKTP